MTEKIYIGILTLLMFSACSDEVENRQIVSENLKEIVSSIKGASSVGVEDKRAVKKDDLFSIDVEFSESFKGTQFVVEKAIQNGFEPLMILEVDDFGRLEGEFSYTPFEMYRLSSQKGTVFFFTDVNDLELKTVDGVVQVLSSNSVETQMLNDYIQFVSVLPQDGTSLTSILDYLNDQKTGYIHYINLRFIAENALDYPDLVDRVKEDFSDEKRYPYAADFRDVFAVAPKVGDLAPEISLPNLNGDIDKLSNYRGTLVLIDFWASWCSPCRVENPNVVRLYEKYKSKGFEIYGISLDKEKSSWEAAIKHDGVTWSQVSDLKGWESSSVKRYKVKSIPYTVLVDQEGRVVALGLKGEELESKLKYLLGI